MTGTQRTSVRTSIRWTMPELEAAIAAIAAQLAGEEGEGDCADVRHEDLEGALQKLKALRTKLKLRQVRAARRG